MAGSTIFQIPLIRDVDKSTIVERMKAQQPLTPKEMSFAAAIFDGNMSPLTAKHSTPGVQDTLTTFDRLFINGVSLRSLCEQDNRTDGMEPRDKSNYMKAFLFTAAFARDNVIEYLPPGKENSGEPNPQIRLDTRLARRDLEQERPKKGFWRTIGEALRIVKPILSTQEAYEEKMRSDEAAGNDQERGATIKNAVVMRASSIQAEASINQSRERTNVSAEIQQEIKGPEQKDKKIVEQKVVELAPDERLDTEKQLKDMRDSKKVFHVYFKVLPRIGFIHLMDEPSDLTRFYERLEINSGQKEGPRQSIGWESKSPPDSNPVAVSDVMRRLQGMWTDVPADEKHPNGKALMISGDQFSAIMAGIDKDINDLDKKLNPPEKAPPSGPGLK